MRGLRSLFSRRPRAAPVASFAMPLPREVFYVIGDIHGRDDLLDRLLAQIDAEAPEARLVCVGDYIDRGEGSAQVLARLSGLERPGAPPSICLLGNHERMCLDFIDNPEAAGARWLRNGGMQTLASYGIGTIGMPKDSAMPDLRDRLVEAMGPDLIAWLMERPLAWQSGTVAVVHAAADPSLAIGVQPESILLWGYPEFAKVRRKDGIWVVHGHTIVETPQAANGLISVDTGAYATGHLTAARIAPDGVSFLMT